WAPAAYLEPEPGRQAAYREPHYGRDIVFACDDLKALMSQIYADASLFPGDSETLYMGSRFNGNAIRDVGGLLGLGRTSNSDLRDINPGALHLALTQYVGAERRSFVAEVDRGSEVWNHPVVSYQSREVGMWVGGWRPRHIARTFLGRPIDEQVSRRFFVTQVEI